MAQILSARALSSSSIALEWDRVSSVDQYFVLVNSSVPGDRYNLTFTNSSGTISNLRPTTTYDCYVVTSNSAGQGARSRLRTVTTREFCVLCHVISLKTRKLFIRHLFVSLDII